MRFVVTGLPRSRTKWASVFLSTPDCPVIHDATPAQIHTAEAISTPLFLQHWREWPVTKVALIERPFSEVRASMTVYGNHNKWVTKAYEEIQKMKQERDVEVFDFHDLDAKRLWKFCHETEVDDAYVNVFEDMNIQQASMDKLRVA